MREYQAAKALGDQGPRDKEMPQSESSTLVAFPQMHLPVIKRLEPRISEAKHKERESKQDDLINTGET